jgi:hypothetical protein
VTRLTQAARLDGSALNVATPSKKASVPQVVNMIPQTGGCLAICCEARRESTLSELQSARVALQIPRLRECEL